MGLEIRPAIAGEMEEFTRIAHAALVVPAQFFARMRPEWTLCAFEDGKMTTSYGAWPLTMRINGEGVDVAGVTSVGTSPVYRRRGYLRQITESHFMLLHERGEQSIAALLASRTAIYQRYGYAVVSTRHSYDVDPRYLEFTITHTVRGSFCEVGDDEFKLLVELYNRFIEDRTGYIQRTRATWDDGALAPPHTDGILSKVVYEEAGKPLGYVIYTLSPLQANVPRLEHHLNIRDLVWLTSSAYQAIWDYFTIMDLESSVVWARVPSDDPLPHILLEPRMLNITTKDGLMARIVDIVKALHSRRYPEEATLIFEVIDEMCPWNQGLWRLETDTAGTSVSRTSQSAQLVMPVSTLAMLLFGQISATEAARMGRLDILEYSALPVWDRVMSTAYRPFCPDIF